jgi:hypothetical protein
MQDSAGAMLMLMCKNNFVVEPSSWLEYRVNVIESSFDLFIERKNVCFVICFEYTTMCFS